MLSRLLAGLAALPLLAQAPPDPERVFRHAVELHRSCSLDAAIREYRAFLKLRPASLEARSNLGAVLARAGRFDEAITEYEAALKRDSANPGILMNLGLAYYKTGRVSEAAAQFAAARAVLPDQPQITLLLADCWLRLGENDKVVALLTPLEQNDPANRAVNYLLGTALVRAKQTARGQVIIDRILRDGDSAEARMLMGSTKLGMHDYAGAAADLRRAVELNPELPEIHGYLGLALQATGDPVAAAAAYRRELERNPGDFQSNLNLGLLLREERSYAESRALLERSLRTRPGDLSARYEHSLVLLGLNDIEGARKGLESVVAQSPKFTQAHVSLATVYYRLRRKADGDRERQIVQKLNEETQAAQPGQSPEAAR